MSFAFHLGLALILTLGMNPLPPAGPSADPSGGPFGPSPAATSSDAPARWVLQSEESEARYRVREQLAGFDFPNDAVGSTRRVSGALVLAEDGSIVPGESSFRVDLTTLVTDNEMRDNYVRRRTLEVEQYPEAVFVPKRFIGLPSPLPSTGSAEFELEGDLTVHGATRSVRWEVTAQMGPSSVSGSATTTFPFEWFGISIPRVARVLSVDNSIRLEVDFRMVPQGE